MAAPDISAVESLYKLSISVIVADYKRYQANIHFLPENTHFDILYKLFSTQRLCELQKEVSNLQTMWRALKATTNKRELLHQCFQAVMDDSNRQTARTLADAYKEFSCTTLNPKELEKCVVMGISLGNFLCEAGWFCCADTILVAVRHLLNQNKEIKFRYARMLDCGVRLVHMRTANCDFSNAQKMWDQVQGEIAMAESEGESYNKALFYSVYCALLFSQNHYTDAYSYCCRALRELERHGAKQKTFVPAKSILDVFRQCSKTCTVKRDFKRAEILIKYAVQFAKEHFGEKHHRYADTLVDYGFYLLNVDAVNHAVEVYQTALDIRKSVFNGKNLYVALAHEDLAYSSYVHEYGTGKFQDARSHAESSIAIIHAILPADHLSLASAKRVKALILEEIAIDSSVVNVGKDLLQEAQALHLSSLELAKKAFGEVNVQTAKHYGNLGRLYQSMNRLTEAEEMHLKAIAIKEKLLGHDDYEVALSVGHLASLYNYDMGKYDEAEKLYLRSITIGVRLFGEGYSGLEYDYRGLLSLYLKTQQIDKHHNYQTILHGWGLHRNTAKANQVAPLIFNASTDMVDVIKQFFQMPSWDTSSSSSLSSATSGNLPQLSNDASLVPQLGLFYAPQL